MIDKVKQRWWVQTAICVGEAVGLVGFIVCAFLLLWILTNISVDTVAAQSYIDF